MKKLIEFKLHKGAFPYFVNDIIGGVEISGKRYGVSEDNDTCYLPDTVQTLDRQGFIDAVVTADILCPDEDGETSRLMTGDEKLKFCEDWLYGHGL